MVTSAAAPEPDPPDASSEPLIIVEYEYIAPANVDDEFLARRLDSIRVLPIRRPVSVVVTSEMAASHAARVHSVYSDPFSQSRVAGRVTAKVVTTQKGHALLVDACLLLPEVRDHSDGSVARTLRHEGLHAVLRDRGEDPHTLIRSLRSSGLNEAQQRLAWMAALALEEFRIEHALNARGEWRAIRRTEQLEAITVDYYDALADLLRSWGGGIVDQLLSLLCELASQLAHGVAEAANGVSMPESFRANPKCDELVCQATWLEMCACLGAAPDAYTEIAEADLQGLVKELSGVLERWLAEVGFALDVDEEGLYVIAL